MPGAPLTIRGTGGPMTITPFRQIHGDTKSSACASAGLRTRATSATCRASRFRGSPTSTCGSSTRCATRPHPSHFSVPEALAWIEPARPRRAVLTHLHGELDYATLKRELPEPIEPAYDGMTIDFGP